MAKYESAAMIFRSGGSLPIMVEMVGSLGATGVAARLPVQDMTRARRWYHDKLGLDPAEERPGGLLYRVGAATFGLFESTGRPSGEHTQMGFDVADIEYAVAELDRRGVVFEDVDVPGLETKGKIADIDGNYPSKGRADRAAWFRDSEGNLIGIGQALP